ncbi:MAG: ribosomal protein S18-alanine N-acetyltransferase [Acidobacteriota bacterium]
MTPVRIDHLRHESDLEDILAIDIVSFSRPWTKAMYEDELRRPERSFILVARGDGGDVSGYCACWAVADELHINNVAVRSDRRRGGIGRALVIAALDEGRRRGARRAWLEVRAANRPARRLYGSLGFTEVMVRRGYYSAPSDDGVVMTAEIQQIGLNPAP